VHTLEQISVAELDCQSGYWKEKRPALTLAASRSPEPNGVDFLHRSHLASAEEARPMTSKPSVITALSCIVLLPGLTASGRLGAQTPNQWVVPAGFQVTVFAENVGNAREMALGPRGTVFVGSWTGKVYAVIDRNGDHKADRVVVIASGLDQPNGVAMHKGAQYVATKSKDPAFR
jgi:glucose/arabinose dehydrogenase